LLDENTGNIVTEGREGFSTTLILEYLDIKFGGCKKDYEKLIAFGLKRAELGLL
jgi:hypothetical protein